MTMRKIALLLANVYIALAMPTIAYSLNGLPSLLFALVWGLSGMVISRHLADKQGAPNAPWFIAAVFGPMAYLFDYMDKRAARKARMSRRMASLLIPISTHSTPMLGWDSVDTSTD
jgi:hypothetical protein